MDLLSRLLNALVYLLFGGAFGISAVKTFLKDKSILRTLACIFGATVFMALGLLNLLGIVAPAWVDVPKNAVLGIVFLMIGAGKLSVMSPTDRIKWLFSLAGVVCILEAVSRGLTAYYWQ